MSLVRRLLKATTKRRTSSSDRQRQRNLRSQLRVEGLEERRVLTAYINEFQYSATLGDAETDQYVELRGTPGESLDVGTYFIGIESADGVGELGDIHTIINLSNQTFGSNGLMVLIQSGGAYSVDPASTVLRGTDGFLGLPATFLSDGGSKIIHGGTSTYFLVQTSTAPLLTDDIDFNDDGLPDGVYNNWTVLDGFSVVAWVEGPFDQKTFANIAFSEDGEGDMFLPGSTVVETDRLGYVGRIGESVGFSADEWLAGTTVEDDDNPGRFQLQHGVFGATRPYAYGGRVLDHVGANNWFGSIEGKVIQDANEDGTQNAGEPGLGAVEVFMDHNADGEINHYWETISADDFEVGTDLSNISSNMSMVSAGSDNVHQGFKIRAVQEPFQADGVHVFAHEGVGFFNDNRRIRMDFIAPVRAVSIDVTGDSDLRATYGRLEIFDKDDNSLGFIRTQPLGADQTENLMMSRPTAEIAWALAYSDDSFMSSSPFGRLDNLSFELPERQAVTGTSGDFFFTNLTNGAYPLTIGALNGYGQVFPANGHGQDIEVAYSDRTDVVFGLKGVTPPTFSDQTITVGENTDAGVLAELPITLGYATQELEVFKLAGDPTGLFSLDPVTFELMLNRQELDFESQSQYEVTMELRDTVDGDLKDTAVITINVLDRNDSPVVDDESSTIEEHAEAGTFVATMSAADEDAGQTSFTWSIVGGNGGGAFTIDEETGEVTVGDPELVDFEAASVVELEIRATDTGAPSASGSGFLTITLTNVNEPPEILDQTLSVFESANEGTAIGTLGAQDPDGGQTLTWTLTGGAGAALFELDSAGELSLAADAQLNFEAQANYLLEVQATDSGTPEMSDIGTITVAVTDVNDAPTITGGDFSVAENSAEGTDVGIVMGMDEDEGQTVSYSIIGGSHASSFEIDEVSGALSVAAGALLNFETHESVTVEVRVQDSHPSPLNSSSVLTITLQDINEAPVIQTTSFVIDENSAEGASVGDVEVDDPDAGDSLTYELVSQAVEWVSIDSTTGAVAVLADANIDFETLSENAIVVRATDSGDLVSEATITIQARDINDAPILIQPIDDVPVEPDAQVQFTVGSENFSDQDLGDQLRLAATDGDGFPLPSWIQFDVNTGQFTVSPTENDVGTFPVRVTAIDNSNASVSDVFDVIVESSVRSWHNAARPTDTSEDGALSAIDALLVINYINNATSSAVPTDTEPVDGLVDVNDDNFVTAIDALLVINELNRGAGEGETNLGAFDWSQFELEEDEDEEETKAVVDLLTVNVLS